MERCHAMISSGSLACTNNGMNYGAFSSFWLGYVAIIFNYYFICLSMICFPIYLTSHIWGGLSRSHRIPLWRYFCATLHTYLNYIMQFYLFNHFSLITGSRFGREMHMSITISNDSRVGGQISNWRHKSPHFCQSKYQLIYDSHEKVARSMLVNFFRVPYECNPKIIAIELIGKNALWVCNMELK